MPTDHLLIKGKVQGVFYRATAKKVADKLQITGWIKNTDKGDVESMVTGTSESLNEFINWCKQGPDSAIVSVVTVTPQPEKSFHEFKIIKV
jgi:acylphosphatase